jgi:hypothetical protein
MPERSVSKRGSQGASYAEMRATPANLEDFALGFSLNEGVVRSAVEIETLEIIPTDNGILLRMVLADAPAMKAYRRRLRRGVARYARAVLLTSPVSVEMVQKTASLGAVALVAVSASTALHSRRRCCGYHLDCRGAAGRVPHVHSARPLTLTGPVPAQRCPKRAVLRKYAQETAQWVEKSGRRATAVPRSVTAPHVLGNR